MSRILEPGEIEALASRPVVRIRLPRPDELFGARAQRLGALAKCHSIEGYLRFAAALAEAQQRALACLAVAPPDAAQLAAAHAHRMPVVAAIGWPRDGAWRAVLRELCATLGAASGFPAEVAATCSALLRRSDAQLEAEAAQLLAGGAATAPASAPFLMAALQVYWSALAATLAPESLAAPESPGVCPVCGSLPVASIVRSVAPAAGLRFLSCSLCATEWHRVRLECTHCGASGGLAYHSIEGGAPAIRAESCEACRGYRKIFYQEHDPAVEPLADDLASVALDLLLGAAGFHRLSGNPLLLQAEG